MSVKLDKVQLEVIINGEKGKFNLNELNQAGKQLNAELRNLPVGTKAFIDKSAELRKVNDQLRNVRRDINGMGTAFKEAGSQASIFQKLIGGIGPAVIAAVGTHEIIKFGEECVKAFNEAQQAEQKLLTALHGNREEQERLIEQAKELQKITIYKDDDIVAAQAFLAAQGHNEEAIKKTIRAAVQLAAVTGVDLLTATKQLSASYEGQLRGIKMLDSRFAEMSKTQLANGAAVDLINEKYQGFAETAGKTGTGPLTILKNRFNDIQEQIGKQLLPMITGVGAGLQDIIDVIAPLFEAFNRLQTAFSATSKEFSAFKILIDVATFPMRMLIKLWTGFINVLAEVPAILSGLRSAFIVFFDDIKEISTNVLGGIGDMLTGVFERDPSEIAAGLARTKTAFSKAGSEIAIAFSEGYREAKDQTDAAQAVQDDKNNKKTIDDLKKNKNTNWKIVTETSALISESSREHYDRELKKLHEHNEEMIREQRQYRDAIIVQMDESVEKQVAIENARYQDQIASLYEQFGTITDLSAQQLAILEEVYKIHLKNLGDVLKGSGKTVEENIQSMLDAVTAQVSESSEEHFQIFKNTVQDIADVVRTVEQGIYSMLEQNAQSIIDNDKATAEERTRAAEHLKKLRLAEAAIILAATLLSDALTNQWGQFVKDLAYGTFQIATIAGTKIPEYHAMGAIVDSPHLGMVGEEGPEAIIPLGSKYRDRGISLWEQAGQILQPQYNTSFISNTSAPGQQSGNEKLMMQMMQELITTQRKLNKKLDDGLDTRLNYDQFLRDTKAIDTAKNNARIGN